MPDTVTNQHWHVYVVQCSDDSFYTGITTNLARRMAEHRSGKRGAKYLRGREPLTYVFDFSVSNRSEASRLESLIKRMPRQQKQRYLDDTEALRALLEEHLAENAEDADQ
jgi:putative endonuclease